MTSKIVKGHDAGPVTPPKRAIDVFPTEGGVVSRQVLSAQEKAEKILVEAEHEAARIIEEAHQVKADFEGTRERARREGFADGHDKGLAQVTEKLVRLESLKEVFYDQAEPEMVQLLMELAEKVIGDVIEQHPDVVRKVVHQALERVIGDRITVRVNPEDYITITSDDGDFRRIIDRTRRLVFKEDDTILKGGCVVETEVGVIDAQIETQLAAIKKALGVP